jgi:xylan 1,4-beta-xylosidase
MHFDIKENTKKEKNTKHWQFCVGSGQAALALRTDYTKQLKYVCQELGFKRVRFHGIFDSPMDPIQGADSYLNIGRAKHFTNYNFLNIGVVYDNILSTGLKPFVELSFMPGRIGKSRKAKSEISGINNSMPKKDYLWIDFIKAFINFLIERYTIEEVITWKFEVWNEPNIFVFFKGSKKDYFHLYEITSRAIKEVDERINVGGPSTALQAWLGEFIDFTKTNNIPLDFVSTHYYPGEPLGLGLIFKYVKSMLVDSVKKMRKLKSGRTIDAGRCFMNDQTEEKVEMKKGLMGENTKISREIVVDKPLYLTEWNLSATITSYSNDTRKVACFLVKSIAEMDSTVDGSSIWAFSDIFDEFIMMPDEFTGGFGLLTVNGIPKPQFHALKLMSKTGDLKYSIPITNEEIEIFVYESENEKQIFVIRQRMKQVKEDDLDYSISIELPFTPTILTLEKIDDFHCNPLKEYEALNKPTLNPKEVSEIIEKSKLITYNLPIDFNDNVLNINSKINVNDIHFYTIKKGE